MVNEINQNRKQGATGRAVKPTGGGQAETGGFGIDIENRGVELVNYPGNRRSSPCTNLWTGCGPRRRHGLIIIRWRSGYHQLDISRREAFPVQPITAEIDCKCPVSKYPAGARGWKTRIRALC